MFYQPKKPLVVALAALSFLPITSFAAEETEAIVVTATRQASRASEILSDVTVISQEDIQNAPQTTLGELLAQQPGVEINSNGGEGTAAGIFIRGAKSGHTLFLLDGQRISSATLGTTNYGSIPLELIERIEILRGPASSLYGSDAIGGVVQVFTRKGKPGAPAAFADLGYGDFDTSRVSAGFAGATESSRYQLSLASIHSGGISTTKPASNNYRSDLDPFDRDSLSGGLEFDLNPANTVGFDILHSEIRKRTDSQFNYSTRNEQTLESYSTFWRHKVNTAWNSTVRAGNARDEDRSIADGALSSIFRTEQDQFLWQNDWQLGQGKFFTSIEHLRQRVASGGPDVTDFSNKERGIDSVATGWLQRYGNSTVQLSMRQDQNTQFGGHRTETVGYGYQFTDHWRGSTSYGTGFKAPAMNDLYYQGTDGNHGNPHLKPETSVNQEASLHFETLKQHFWLTYFENRIQNLIDWSFDPVTYVYAPSNINQALITGTTAGYQQNWVGGWRLNATATLQNPRDIQTGSQLNSRAREHGKVGLTRSTGDWQWTAEAQAQGNRYNDAQNTPSQKMGGYTLANAQIAYQLEKNWTAYARLNNIFNRDYELAYGYNTPGANVFVGIRYGTQ